MSRSQRNYCITIYNKELNDIKYQKEHIKYMILGEEICPKTKKKHLQGYIDLWKKTTLKKVKEIFNDNSIHIEKIRGSKEENRAYCQKCDNFQEWGLFTKGQGVRNDLVRLKEKIKAGMTDLELLEDNPEYIHKYDKFINRVRQIYNDNKTAKEFKEENFLKEYTKNHKKIFNAVEKIKNDKRKILWVYSEEGNIGKSDAANHMLCTMDAIQFDTTKRADIALAYKGQKYIIFDFCRSIDDKINYGTLEALKNGRIFSSKYGSKLKLFKRPCIICFANTLPDTEKMSPDRWELLHIDSGLFDDLDGSECHPSLATYVPGGPMFYKVLQKVG